MLCAIGTTNYFYVAQLRCVFDAPMMRRMDSPVARAIKHCGSQAALASALGVTQPTISEWLTGGRQVPAERCPQIEGITCGAVRCEDLRPDVAWGVLREQATPAAAAGIANQTSATA